MKVNQLNNNLGFNSLDVHIKASKNMFPAKAKHLEESLIKAFLKNDKEIGTHLFDKYDIYIEKQGTTYNVLADIALENHALIYSNLFKKAKNEPFNKFAKRVIRTTKYQLNELFANKRNVNKPTPLNMSYETINDLSA